MAELRWVLVGLGLAVLAGVYLWSRLRSRKSDQDALDERVEPRLDEAATWAERGPVLTADEPAHETGETGLLFEDLPVAGVEDDVEPPEPPSASPERILVIHIRALNPPGFGGRELVSALLSEGLEYSDPGVFIQQSDQGQTLFTLANMFEPGSIPREAEDGFVTPGVTAFMVLPGPGNADTVARMVALARRLATRLSGEVLDEAGSTLTNQRATHMREEVIEFQRRSQISAQNL